MNGGDGAVIALVCSAFYRLSSQSSADVYGFSGVLIDRKQSHRALTLMFGLEVSTGLVT